MPKTPDFIKDFSIEKEENRQDDKTVLESDPGETVNYNEALNAFNNANAKALDILVNLEA